jgi:conjugal transfer pilus assembly protein TraB
MSEVGSTSAASVKQRQYLLLAVVVAMIIGAAIIGVAVTTPRQDNARPEKSKTTNLLAPGAQVDPKDAWRGQADAQMRSIEQKSLEMNQKNSELAQQNKDMLDRLKKLEQSGLIPLPPPPVRAPAARPEFGPAPVGPDKSPSVPAFANPPPLSMPPGRPLPAVGNAAPAPVGTAAAIVSVSLGDGVAGKTGATSDKTSADAKKNAKTIGNYLPSGSFTRAVLLGGLDAPTGGQSQKNPQPVLMRLTDNAILPNRFRFRVKECFVVGAGYGDMSSERAYVRTETLSCITHGGQAVDIAIKGYVAGEDGKAGMRGRLVSKQGQLLANALTAGIASGIGHAFQQNASTYSVSPLGSTTTINQGEQFTAGMGAGIGRALDRLAQYYITLAEKIFPVIEVDAGRLVDVVITQGAAIEGMESADDSSDENLTALVSRNHQLKGNRNEVD